MEFDLPKRDILIAEAIDGAKAMIDDVGALAQDPTFLAMAKLQSGQPTSSQVPGASGGLSTVRNVLPGLSTDTAEAVLGQQGPGGAQFGAALEGLIPDPAIYKFETGTGYEIRPVIQPDGQAVVFHFNYMYTTNIREPVRADEKHLGRSQTALRRHRCAVEQLRAARGQPVHGGAEGGADFPRRAAARRYPAWWASLFRPLPSDESSLQQNIIMAQATIFPTLFDLMGLRWAPAVADLDPLRLSNDEFIVRNRRRVLDEPRVRPLQLAGRRIPADPGSRTADGPVPLAGDDSQRPPQRLFGSGSQSPRQPVAGGLLADQSSPDAVRARAIGRRQSAASPTRVRCSLRPPRRWTRRKAGATAVWRLPNSRCHRSTASVESVPVPPPDSNSGRSSPAPDGKGAK